jgi:hypothetical protein
MKHYFPSKVVTPQKVNPLGQKQIGDDGIPKKNTFLSAIRGDPSHESKNFFTQAAM